MAIREFRKECQYFLDIKISFRVATGLPSSICVVRCATVKLWPYWLIELDLLKTKFMTLKTDENELKILKITAMLFGFAFLCIFC